MQTSAPNTSPQRVQSGVPPQVHSPPSQVGFGSEQVTPHPPQFAGSVNEMHVPPQQPRPPPHPGPLPQSIQVAHHGGGHGHDRTGTDSLEAAA